MQTSNKSNLQYKNVKENKALKREIGSDRNVCPVGLLNLVLARKVQPIFAQYKYGQGVVRSKF